jgi:hemolysin activation/secretion protein
VSLLATIASSAITDAERLPHLNATPIPPSIVQLPRQDVLPPRPVLPLPEDALPPQPVEKPLVPPIPADPPIEPPDTEETITVTEFQFTGNTAFSAAQLAVTTENLTDRPLSLPRLLQVAADVARIYADAGYITSGAIISIPDATREKGRGVVEVQVIEGELSEIRVRSTNNSPRLRTGYVRSRLALAATKPLNINQLQEALQLLQLDPLIARVSSSLLAGTRPEQSILEVEITEADTFSWQLLADNYRPPSIGSFERGTQISESNLLGWGDRIDLTYLNTNGSHLVDTSYTLPFNPHNGTIGFNFYYQTNEIIEEPFNRLDIKSNSISYELQLRQPVIRRIDPETQSFQELAFGITAFWQETRSFLLGSPFPLSLGSDDEGRARVFALRFLTDWTRQNANSVIALRSELSVGLDFLGSTVNEQISGVDTIPDSRFLTWRGQFQWVYFFAPENLFLFRSNLQIANDALLPSEQFGLGGFNSVRGYAQDILVADNGWLTSAEVRLPVLKIPQVQGVVQLVPFVDFGIVWNSGGNPNPNPQHLAAVGVGLLFQGGDRFTARVDFGIPLVELNSGGGSRQTNSVLFSVQLNLF